MLSGYQDGKDLSLIDIFEGVGKVAAGAMSEPELCELECNAMPGCGSCQGLYTANTMACMTEALGMCLPGCAAIPAADAAKLRIARESGEAIINPLVKNQVRPRDIITKKSLQNAIRVDMALVGSTNTVLYLMAIAVEANVPLTLDDFNSISDTIPHICHMQPSGPHSMETLYRAGGIPAVPMVFLVNKADLVAGGPFDQKTVEAIARHFGSIYRLTSAKTGENVERAFTVLGEYLVRHMRGIPGPAREPGELTWTTRASQRPRSPKGIPAWRSS